MAPGSSGNAVAGVAVPSKPVVCDNDPTPAPESIIGQCGYYQFRYDDFMKRHQSCPHAAPDYYLNYGLKYCKRFSTDLYPKLSNDGKAWLVRAKKLLQVLMEEGLKFARGKMVKSSAIKRVARDVLIYRYDVAGVLIDRLVERPIANELDSDEFSLFAFGTHPDAYWGAGFVHLSFSDWGYIIETPDFSDWLRPEVREQAAEIFSRSVAYGSEYGYKEIRDCFEREYNAWF